MVHRPPILDYDMFTVRKDELYVLNFVKVSLRVVPNKTFNFSIRISSNLLFCTFLMVI